MNSFNWVQIKLLFSPAFLTFKNKVPHPHSNTGYSCFSLALEDHEFFEMVSSKFGLESVIICSIDTI